MGCRGSLSERTVEAWGRRKINVHRMGEQGETTQAHSQHSFPAILACGSQMERLTELEDNLFSVSLSLENENEISLLSEFSSVQSLSRVRLFATPWIAARQASLSITNFQSSLRLTSIESVMPSSHLILCHPLFLPPSIFPSIRVFSNELAKVSVLRRQSFSEYSGLICFRTDWFDLLAVQGTFKSLFQHHSSKASILRNRNP